LPPVRSWSVWSAVIVPVLPVRRLNWTRFLRPSGPAPAGPSIRRPPRRITSPSWSAFGSGGSEPAGRLVSGAPPSSPTTVEPAREAWSGSDKRAEAQQEVMPDGTRLRSVGAVLSPSQSGVGPGPTCPQTLSSPRPCLSPDPTWPGSDRSTDPSRSSAPDDARIRCHSKCSRFFSI